VSRATGGSSGPRFSLRTLLISMGVIASLIPLGGFLLRNASTWMGPLVVLVTAWLLAAAVAMAVNRQGAARAYWAGCAIFGLAYFIIAGDPWSQPYNYELFTETVSTAAYYEFFPEGDADPAAPAIPTSVSFTSEPATAGGLGAASDAPELRDFVMMAHMFWSLAFGFAGGWISLLMYWTGQRQSSRQGPSEQQP